MADGEAEDDGEEEEGWTLRRIRLVLQIVGALLVIVLKALEIARAGRELGVQIPSLGWARWGLVIYLYAYIAFDFYDAWVRDLLDRTLVLITAALAFVALSMLLFLPA